MVDPLWALCLFAKILGEEEPLATIMERARDWRVDNKMDIRKIGNGFFLISFTSEEDYDKGLKKGPWMVNGKYWKPWFNPLKAKLESADIWIRLPGLPLECWNRDDLEIILEKLGPVIKLDDDTLKLEKTLYPMVCARVDLTGPFILEIPVTQGGIRSHIRVFYKNIFDLCINYGWRGHKFYECSKKRNERIEDGWSLVQNKKRSQSLRSKDDLRKIGRTGDKKKRKGFGTIVSITGLRLRWLGWGWRKRCQR
ncbi:PREDICTED: uncharacterized protein LOC104602095 [Nelumbo nucifera]|uniref:Uncharacterized protein LOC104602095 n=1 Tax=Nelumbo nucifera TaxID=4432 RepID=A0A1U8AMJ7_NELNU|nr:PREDICTED: uncharacterized protein LOC104602095 [Nelumbo nucifera]